MTVNWEAPIGYHGSFENPQLLLAEWQVVGRHRAEVWQLAVGTLPVTELLLHAADLLLRAIVRKTEKLDFFLILIIFYFQFAIINHFEQLAVYFVSVNTYTK